MLECKRDSSQPFLQKQLHSDPPLTMDTVNNNIRHGGQTHSRLTQVTRVLSPLMLKHIQEVTYGMHLCEVHGEPDL